MSVGKYADHHCFETVPFSSLHSIAGEKKNNPETTQPRTYIFCALNVCSRVIRYLVTNFKTLFSASFAISTRFSPGNKVIIIVDESLGKVRRLGAKNADHALRNHEEGKTKFQGAIFFLKCHLGTLQLFRCNVTRFEKSLNLSLFLLTPEVEIAIFTLRLMAHSISFFPRV